MDDARDGAPARPAWYRSACWAATGLALLALSGCGNDADSYFRQGPRPGASLAGRPTLPAIVRSYEALLRELRTALEPKLGTTGWSYRDPTAPTALCQDFGVDPDTGIRTLPFTLHERFVPEPAWEEVVTIVKRVAARRGFDQSARIVDRPDEHRLDLSDRYGAELSFQDGPKLLSIGLITGCHLRTEQPAANAPGRSGA